MKLVEGVNGLRAVPEVNSLYFRRDGRSEVDLWEEIGSFVGTVVNQGNVVMITDEGPGIVIEWSYDNQEADFGCDRAMWVSSEEEDMILEGRIEAAAQYVKREEQRRKNFAILS